MSSHAPSGGLSWYSGLFAGLGAAGVAWAVAWALYPFFLMPAELREPPVPTPPEIAAARYAAQGEATWKNSCTMLALTGGLVAGALALADGAARRSAKRALAGLALGVVLASVVAFLGLALASIVERSYGAVGERDELPRTMLVQAAALGSLGIGVGLTLGLRAGGWAAAVRAIVAGLLGGLLAAGMYPILSAFLLPNEPTENLVPGGLSNLGLWMALFGGLVGAAIPGLSWGRAADRRDRR